MPVNVGDGDDRVVSTTVSSPSSAVLGAAAPSLPASLLVRSLDTSDVTMLRRGAVGPNSGEVRCAIACPAVDLKSLSSTTLPPSPPPPPSALMYPKALLSRWRAGFFARILCRFLDDDCMSMAVSARCASAALPASLMEDSLSERYSSISSSDPKMNVEHTMSSAVKPVSTL